ncbi:Por secretion system C-terminal sorting domain-containing protein [Flaviramulus basaltis]|uniref:Por secretion system C-terminal sorting domain-containing protein n=1 Tax=Flaviramulus basaltis TaxID=369401 RepID=A0A1K2IJG6_9FLAO|nr:endonuclease [Flaviramulus basaltis]SFZ92535.1 Por secretion system C-terminal sorting domain-containing protein [Flaviramulus basaltis]
MMKKLLLLLLLTSFTATFAQEAYYQDVDLTLTGIQLKTALSTKITDTHTNMLSYTPGVWEASKATDENPQDNNTVLLIYGWEDGRDSDPTNDRFREKNLTDNGSGQQGVWNREHVFAKSLANPNLSTENPGPGTDAFNLRPADREENSTRNNRKYGTGSGYAGFSNDTFEGLGGPNTNAWYPGDEWKGDVARIIMYMYVRYGNMCLPTAVGVGTNEFTPDDMIDLFLKWNVEDPVSDFEKKRNTFHESRSETYAQGNRNPFVDNPYLATRIWGGESAEDTWGIYSSSDAEAPTVPINVSINSITTTSFNVSWTASTDNVEVTGYDVYVDGVLTAQTTTSTTASISDLNSNTTYSITVVARDLVNNKSDESTPVNATTLQDSQAPSIPINLVVSNETDSSFTITWNASTDNTAVTGYEAYLDGTYIATTSSLTYTFTGLTPTTNYTAAVLAKDAANNKSGLSASVNATTTDGSSNGVSELFFSEYIEPAGGNNKALEIVNATSSTISLVGYSIKKQSNGSGAWIDEIDLASGSVTNIVPGDVFVIINADAADATLIAQADMVYSNPDTYNSPINFNGNDPIGLFKNGVLIDIIGTFGNGNSNFAADVTLRRKSTITSPNTTYTVSEWDSFAGNTFSDIGSHTVTLGIKENIFNSFVVYPNPTNIGKITLKVPNNISIDKVKLYSIIGNEIYNSNAPQITNQKLTINNLKQGIYLLKIDSGSSSITKKIIVQ